MRLRNPQKAVTYSDRRKITDTKSINERRIFFGLCRSGKSRPSDESRSGKSEKRHCFPARKVWSIAHKFFLGLTKTANWTAIVFRSVDASRNSLGLEH